MYVDWRYYSPSLGRWTSHDPIEERGGPNLLAFTGNDPVNYVDPHGAQRLVFAFAGLAEHPDDPFFGGASYPIVGSDWKNRLLQAPRLVHEHNYHYFAQTQSREAAALAYLLADQPSDEDPCAYPTFIALGFSNGAVAAVEFARELRKHRIKVDLAFTADPVPSQLLLEPGSSQLRAPWNVDMWVNHYQRAAGPIVLIRGHPIQGAHNEDWSTDPRIRAVVHSPYLGFKQFARPHMLVARLPEVLDDLRFRVEQVPVTRPAYKYP